ncbi:MAG TPA: hypothetical protein DCL41_01125 [Bdellovibrionales bacterium]|nr:hypothetical protein [Pseudobdellovibrionaceae bacterium]HAG90440.1 hypothetical protein [Bdellovibrionales bacterium]|tara:strand:+ start:802 stop:1716 length:915 start_codon:yes stop_codon:yes gene_type:complete
MFQIGNNMDLDLVQIFVQVVKNGSFTKAAQQLRLPKSTVSKALSRLEKDTGTQLLVRTTRSQTLTAAGKEFYDTCVGPLEVIENARKSLYGNDNLITGKIKLTASEDLGSHIIAPAIAELCHKHPGLKFELNYTDDVLDLVADGYDLAVRIGRLKESSLKVKKIGELKLMLVASPKYLDGRPRISKVEDLESQDCLALSSTLNSSGWKLKSKSKSVQVPIRPRIASNQMSSLLAATVAGGGIALAPTFLCEPYLRAKKLVQVLPQWSSMGVPVSMLSPLPFSSSARLRTTTDHLATALQSALGS